MRSSAGAGNVCGLRSIAATLAALLASAGCYTSHARTPYEHAGNVQISRSFEAAMSFQYEKTEVPFSNHIEETGASSLYELRLLEIPSIGDNGQKGDVITARYYRSVLPGSHPLLIVLPIWGTYTYPPRKTSSSIQRQSRGSVHVLYVQGDDYIADWAGLVAAEDEAEFLELWRQAAERMRVTVVDVRRLIDWAEERPEIDPDRVALIGFSFSAVVAGTIATQESRLAATVAVMGGSHLQSIIATCDGKRATSVREKAAMSFGWSTEELEARLEPIMDFLDPATYANRVDPWRVLVIDASRDDCVPQASRDDLWEALGRPERISLNYGHAPAFFAMSPLGLNWLSGQIWEFLKPRLIGRSHIDARIRQDRVARRIQ